MHLWALDAPAGPRHTCWLWMQLLTLDAPASPGRTRGHWTHLLTLDAPAGPGLPSALDAPAAPTPPLPSFHLAERGRTPATPPPGENGVVPPMGVLGAVRAFVSVNANARCDVSPWPHLEGTLDSVRAAEETFVLKAERLPFQETRPQSP
uniref:interleukin-15 isoform X3 n=1 Tax=Nyctereutes procyonoides TaxID=34880 RepID=UPI00244457CB|nr:interleukin-15 isoform X3 [Nyctereutes procyonoides]